MSVKGKVAIITGGGGSIGKATATRIAEEGGHQPDLRFAAKERCQWRAQGEPRQGGVPGTRFD